MPRPTPKKSLSVRWIARLRRISPAIWIEACGGDAALRAASRNCCGHDASRQLSRRQLAVGDRSVWPITECAGHVIGPYKLLQQIGEGGMGVVFMAEQTEPVQRTVALKIIKPGMDTRQVIARFEAERQALAMMDHPNIAKVLDAGTTDSGRPYFVMELVKGVPITEVLRRTTSVAPRAAGAVHARSARPCSMPIRRASSIAISSPPTCSWPSTTTSRAEGDRLRRGQSHGAAD